MRINLLRTTSFVLALLGSAAFATAQQPSPPADAQLRLKVVVLLSSGTVNEAGADGGFVTTTGLDAFLQSLQEKSLQARTR